MPSTALSQSVPVTTSTQANPSATTPVASGSYDIMSMGLPLVFMAALYFMIIRPNNKRMNEQKKMVDSIKSGDEVVVAGGNMGIVTKVEDNHIHLKVADTLELLFQRQAVQHVLPKGTLKLPAIVSKHTQVKHSS